MVPNCKLYKWYQIAQSISFVSHYYLLVLGIIFMNLKENESIPEKIEYKLRFNPSYTPSTAKIKARSETYPFFLLSNTLLNICVLSYLSADSLTTILLERKMCRRGFRKPFQTSRIELCGNS